jgi:hypothetical protein
MINALLVSLAAIAAFAVGLHYMRIGGVARGILQNTSKGTAAMTNTELTDDEKEVLVRRAGVAVFLGGWSIFWRFAVCLIAAFIPIYLDDAIQLANDSDVIEVMLRPAYIILVSLGLVGIVWLAKRSGSANTHESATAYNAGDRMIHMLAFSSRTLQKLAARTDDFIFRLLNRDSENQSPIFITSLARSGTTALLNAFSDLPFVATHTYRDMPFIMAPYLWSRVNAPFRRKVKRTERAHGDGLEIDLDSPEAFDEVYWKLYWPEKYREDDISLWHASDDKTEAISRLQTCFRKIAHVRQRPLSRYLSKNNANIARLRLIPNVFPGAHLVVPVRRPAPHAASLLRQHQNFIAMQTNDDFVRRYMRDIGHFEFGLLHKPIAFEGFEHSVYEPDCPDYWLVYWIAAFREVRANLDICHIILQDDLRLNANSCVRHLLAKLGFSARAQDFTPYFRSVPDKTNESVFSPNLLEVADSLYTEIARQAVR